MKAEIYKNLAVMPIERAPINRVIAAGLLPCRDAADLDEGFRAFGADL